MQPQVASEPEALGVGTHKWHERAREVRRGLLPHAGRQVREIEPPSELPGDRVPVPAA